MTEENKSEDARLVDVLEDMARNAEVSIYPCRVMLDTMGIRVNMWYRERGTAFYVDSNFIIGWTELQYTLNSPMIEKTRAMFTAARDNITKRIKLKREFEQQAQQILNEKFKDPGYGY